MAYTVRAGDKTLHFTKKEKAQWYAAGWRAAKSGKLRSANPHRPRSEEWHTWNDGYDDSKDWQREQKPKAKK